MYVYDDRFYDQADETAAYSADGLIKRIAAELPIRSVLDVGCGRGVWLSRWLQRGATEVIGIDGPYVDRKQLAIDPSSFEPRDVTAPFSLGRKFDLVQSLEVAEHLPADRADIFIDNLTGHGSLVLFSAAVPGQGGEHHINEQPWEYWRQKFAARGFEVFDFLRPRVADDYTIYRCYRFNSFLFAHRSAIASLPPSIHASRVPRGAPLRNAIPLLLRLRYALVRLLPQRIVDWLARLKYWAHGTIGRRRQP